MQSHVKVRAIRALGGVVVALAVVPWLGAGAASASGGSVASCSTRPAGVSPDATCVPLLAPNGTTLLGATWAVRTSSNHIVVDTFPSMPVVGAGAVALCVQTTGPYPAKNECLATQPDNVFSGSVTHVDVALSAHGIKAADSVWYSLTVLQGSDSATSNGGVGVSPSGTPTPTTTPSQTPSETPSQTPSKTPTQTPSVTPSHTPTHSPSVSPTTTTTHSHSPSPSTSVLPSDIDGTPSVSVLGTKLAHTGGAGVAGALVVSVALLGLGGMLLVGAQTIPAAARRRH